MRWFARQPDVIALDFIPQRRRPGALGWLLLVAGLLAALGVLGEYVALGERLASAQTRLARETRHLERSRSTNLARQREKLPEAELRRAADLARRLHNRNLEVLADIEAASNADISLLSLSQTAGKAQLKLAGEARSLDAAFAFARRLARQPGLLGAQIDSYEFKSSGSVEVVVFSLSASWRTTP